MDAAGPPSGSGRRAADARLLRHLGLEPRAPRAPARVRLEQQLGPELTRRLLRALSGREL